MHPMVEGFVFPMLSVSLSDQMFPMWPDTIIQVQFMKKSSCVDFHETACKD